MILSQTSEYVIRAVAFIAVQTDDKPVAAKELSKHTSIPAHYLSKVLRKLVTANILNATKGHNGGFVLARPAHKVKIIDILSAVESHVPAKHCIFGWRMCNSKDPCILHHRWSAVNDAFQTWARTTTLADIKNDAGTSRWLTTFKEKSATDDDAP
ncbi:MAG: Rrf2 family transcriptional regulator [Deltaproteobacteria bacterium]|nr:Rrf2 family transcriptional regulator [Deltaproteobacteria bacterium]